MYDLNNNPYQREYRRIKLWILLNVLLYVTIECISSLNVTERFLYLAGHLDIILINFTILLIITCPCLLFHKMAFVFNLLAIGILGITYASRILLVIRGLPLRWPDFFIAKEGLSIADKYLSPDLILLIIILTTMGIFLLTKSYSCRRDLYHPKLVACFIVLITTLNFVVISKAQKNDPLEMKKSMDYSEEGMVYSFVTSYESNNEAEPPHYSKERLSSLRAQLNKNIIMPISSKDPNIIFLQVESFIDPMELKDLTYSQDPIPRMRQYLGSSWSGMLEVPDINTARTEFEILTGIKISQLFKYEVPYTSDAMDGRPIESVAHVLRKYKNYHTTAIHNHEGSFYHRDQVYGVLGFDHFIALEQMEGVAYSKNWPKDIVLLKYITETLERTETRDFIFAVTVGTHSSYDYDYEENTSGITISGDKDIRVIHQVQDYIDRFSETDQFVGQLIDYVHQMKEPTILVVYGDHIPALDAITYDKDYVKDQVPYFVISNYSLRHQKSSVLPAYRMYTEVLNAAGIKGGMIWAVHNIFKDRANYFETLQLIAYDLVLGNRWISDGQDIYKPSDLKLGTP